MGQQNKGSGKQGGDKGGKQSGKDANKQGGKASKSEGKQGKKSNNKTSSVVSSCLCVCVILVYSMMVGYLGGQAIKTVGDNPELLKMAAMASDNRLKKQIETATYGMKEIMQLKPKSYLYINEDENTTRHIGLMAQDIQNVIPELVVEIDNKRNGSFREHLPEDIKNETMYGVKYQELIPVLINAIKELKEEVDTLKSKL